ncbi:27304_t:CDS:2 [Dentiscutata erythropus]|uniref:27304_t:CDS:1 n=1 Tax=Dentiscutata erythropus TaxID=1348616 RepID=A0A9N8ZHQ2_9GLOM|nr:27304_t:CDS:2 [Dentiscutata erythropus]
MSSSPKYSKGNKGKDDKNGKNDKDPLTTSNLISHHSSQEKDALEEKIEALKSGDKFKEDTTENNKFGDKCSKSHKGQEKDADKIEALKSGDKLKEDTKENNRSTKNQDDDGEPVKQENAKKMSKMLETLDSKLSKHPIAFHFLAFFMQCILAVIASINVKVKPDTGVKKAVFEIERENLQVHKIEKVGERLYLGALALKNATFIFYIITIDVHNEVYNKV